MDIIVLFNNERISDMFENGWGFSCLIDHRILFDTGEKWEYLARNMRKKRVDISRIESVFISHDHWDHTGGLWGLLEQRPGLTVYGCNGFSGEFKRKVGEYGGVFIALDEWTPVADAMITTGEIPCQYKGEYLAEQALIVSTFGGIVIAVGCCHPGVLTIVKKVRERYPAERVLLLFGGFHLMEKDRREVRLIAHELKLLGVEKTGPTHCTGEEAQTLFREAYGNGYMQAMVGQSFEI